MKYHLLFLFVLALPLEARFDPEMEKLHIEIGDLAKGLHTLRIDLDLLEEKNRKQDRSSELVRFEKKLLEFERTLEKVSTDVRSLNQSIGQAIAKVESLEPKIHAHDQRLAEVSKLKETLTSISKAISNKPKEAKTYLVKPGDSLEKIAKMHQVSVDMLRKQNQLTQDKIFAGQELRIE